MVAPAEDSGFLDSLHDGNLFIGGCLLCLKLITVDCLIIGK